MAFRYGNRTPKYQVFDKLAFIDQGRIVDNKPTLFEPSLKI
ncbi:hypothetical protein F4826_001009 [Rahnella inusitata]|nr:hypothetical protein [Rahnella inusitata]